MTTLALIFTLAAIGISETVYLIRQRVSAQKVSCPINGECERVLNSKYNKIFIIPNDILGLLAYLVIAVMAAFLVIGIEPVVFWNLVIKILVTIASLASVFFTYLQWRVIRVWCFWCLMSAGTIWLMGVILLINNFI